MKNMLFFSLAFCVVILATCWAQATEQSKACTTAVLIDTSPTAHWDELLVAAQSVYKSCLPADTILLFTVRGKTTHLVFSCVKRPNDCEFADFCSILKTIKPDWFVRLDIAATTAPVYRKLLQHSGPGGHTVVIIVTDGNLDDKQAGDLCKFADDINLSHKWPLLVTGTTKKTNKTVLKAATEGRLFWCNLAEAVNGTDVDRWMRQIRQAATSSSEKASIPLTTITAEQKPNATERDSSVESKGQPAAAVIARWLRNFNTYFEDSNSTVDHRSAEALRPVQKALREELVDPNLLHAEQGRINKPDTMAPLVKSPEHAEPAGQEGTKTQLLPDSRRPSDITASGTSQKPSPASKSTTQDFSLGHTIEKDKTPEPFLTIPKSQKPPEPNVMQVASLNRVKSVTVASDAGIVKSRVPALLGPLRKWTPEVPKVLEEVATPAALQKVTDAEKPPATSFLPASEPSREKSVQSPSAVRGKEALSSKMGIEFSAGHKTPVVKERLLSPLLIVGGISIPSIVAFVVVCGWLAAAKWQKAAEQPLEVIQSQEQDQSQILMVRVNGVLQRIGDLRCLKNFHLGSAPENTIRIAEKVISSCHARVSRKGGKLFIRNMSKNPIIVNGQEVQPRKRHQLILPSVVTVAEGVAIDFFLQEKPKENQKSEGKQNVTSS
jgi:hypothetical protein